MNDYEINIKVRVPNCAKWIAQDANGEFWFYTSKPQYNDFFNMWSNKLSKAGQGVPNKKWRDAIYKIVRRT